MNGQRHDPDRTSWDCLSCAAPWPCDPAREHAASNFSPSALAMYMVAHMTEAARTIPVISAEELHERFLSWTRQVRQGPQNIDKVSTLDG